ncbi:MAG: DUF1576 domain-containing protein [Treponema sp.]|nr:DUF1576 domain-containing protein [Treponema sp.]
MKQTSVHHAKSARYEIPVDYYIMFGICVLFVVVAFFTSTPQEILSGYIRIHTSRSVLVTDYVELAGLGAALVNSAVLVFFNLLLLIMHKRNPDGKIIAALFLTIGFSLFGKNMFNTLPIMAGVWLYGKVSNIKFSTLVVHAMICTTIAPIVSEIAFLGDGQSSVYRIVMAYGTGIFVGFIFPVVAEYVKRMHSNFCLYNGGIAGGFIATMFAGIFRSIGMEIVPEAYWATSQEVTTQLTILACSIAVALIVYGIVTNKPSVSFSKFKEIQGENNPDDSDYFAKYGSSCYKNIGIMCILSIAVMHFLNVLPMIDEPIPINGPILGGIFTISGFAAFGKNLRNTIPVLIGSIIAVLLNHLESTAPVNILAILFSTGLAPIAGKYGWHWGIATGFLHVSIAVFIGDINGGLNLYNNGFAGSFVAVLILPVIEFFRTLYEKTKTRVSGRNLK